MIKDELIKEINECLPELTTKQFYIRSINNILKLKMIHKVVQNLNDLNNLSEGDLRILLNDMKDILTAQMKERLRFHARNQQKGPGELL